MEVDTLAKAYLNVIRKEQGGRRQQQIHGEGWSVWLVKWKVTSSLQENYVSTSINPKFLNNGKREDWVNKMWGLSTGRQMSKCSGGFQSLDGNG